MLSYRSNATPVPKPQPSILMSKRDIKTLRLYSKTRQWPAKYLNGHPDQALVDAGLLSVHEVKEDGLKLSVVRITDAGLEYLAKHSPRVGRPKNSLNGKFWRGIMKVTKDNYPTLHSAFVEIEMDNGAHHVNRIHGEGTVDLERFQIPEAWQHLVVGAERGLVRLKEGSEDDFDTFVAGEMTEAAEIEKRQGDLAEARIILNDWFNGWQPEDQPFRP